MTDIIYIQTGSSDMCLFEIQGIKSVIVIHMRLQDRKAIRMSGHFAEKKLQGGRSLAA